MRLRLHRQRTETGIRRSRRSPHGRAASAAACACHTVPAHGHRTRKVARNRHAVAFRSGIRRLLHTPPFRAGGAAIRSTAIRRGHGPGGTIRLRSRGKGGSAAPSPVCGRPPATTRSGRVRSDPSRRSVPSARCDPRRPPERRAVSVRGSPRCRKARAGAAGS